MQRLKNSWARPRASKCVVLAFLSFDILWLVRLLLYNPRINNHYLSIYHAIAPEQARVLSVQPPSHLNSNNVLARHPIAFSTTCRFSYSPPTAITAVSSLLTFNSPKPSVFSITSPFSFAKCSKQIKQKLVLISFICGFG